jgi:hypothetical protein
MESTGLFALSGVNLEPCQRQGEGGRVSVHLDLAPFPQLQSMQPRLLGFKSSWTTTCVLNQPSAALEQDRKELPDG